MARSCSQRNDAAHSAARDVRMCRRHRECSRNNGTGPHVDSRTSASPCSISNNRLSSVNCEGFRANDFARHGPRKDMDTVLKTTRVMRHVRVQRRPAGRPRLWMTDFSASISALEPALAWAVQSTAAQSVAYMLIFAQCLYNVLRSADWEVP